MKRSMRSMALVLALSTWLGAGAASANHYWYCFLNIPYHYANSVIPFLNAATGIYTGIVAGEAETDANSWERATDVEFLAWNSFLAQLFGGMRVYSGSYGSTSWLGIAEIRSVNGCQIRDGRVRLNRSWLDSGSYTNTNRRHVACQEIGHLLGLDHDRASTTSCMNDTVLTQPQPSSHDIASVNVWY